MTRGSRGTGLVQWRSTALRRTHQMCGHHVTLVLNFFDELKRIAPVPR